jgi:hypothetical protein
MKILRFQLLIYSLLRKVTVALQKELIRVIFPDKIANGVKVKEM